MKSLQAQFSFFSTADTLYCICIRENMWCNYVSCFDQDMALSNNVNTSENKLNTSRNSKSIPFSLHGGQRGLGFLLYLDFLCPPTAATMGMMYTGKLVL